MQLVERKCFESPDRAEEPYEKAHGDWIALMGQDVGRMTLQPGWNWTEHSAPVDGTERCERFHVKLFISGRFAVAYQDGTEVEFGPGDIAVIQPGHDAWAVGDEPVVYFSLGPLFKRAAGAIAGPGGAGGSRDRGAKVG